MRHAATLLLVAVAAVAPGVTGAGIVSEGSQPPTEAELLEQLHARIDADDADGATGLLDEGAPLNQISEKNGGQTPLMHAVLSGKAKLVEMFLARGADTTIGEKDGYTPMHGATFQGRAEVAQLLIAHGLDPSDRHRDGFTPLHRACWGRARRHTDTVKVLLDAGVPADGPAKDGSLPLSMTYNMRTMSLLRKSLKERTDQMLSKDEL